MFLFTSKFNLSKFILAWLPPVLWASLIFFFSSLPVNAPGALFNLFDFIFKKTLHVIEYAILAFLVFRALFQTFDHQNFTKYQATTFVICLTYAISDEFHQSFVPGRTATIRDVIIDTIGIGLALYLIKMLKDTKRFKKVKKIIFG